MFGRGKRKGKEPVANQLSGAAEPNVLRPGKSGRSGKAGTPDSADLGWTVDGAAGDLEPEDDEFEPEDDLDAEADDRTPAQRRADLQAELERQAEEFGLTGSNPVGLYGPNGENVASLLDSLPGIDYDTAEAIADAYDAVPDAERKVAQSVIRRRHRGRLEPELELAERAVSDWLASLILSADDEALYGIVADAAADAVDALVLEGDLADADFATLYGPWSEVMDVDEDDEVADDEADENEEPDGSDVSAAGDENADVGTAAGDGSQDGEFGPNTPLVVELLTKLGTMEAAQTEELVGVWREQPKDDLKVAHRAMQALADEDATWREQLRLAQEEVFAWMDARITKYSDNSFGTDDARIRQSAGPTVADAVAALVMADILEPEDAETLYAPWADVVGEPALPTYEEDDET